MVDALYAILLIGSGIVLCLLISEWDDNRTKKENELLRIKSIKDVIIKDFGDLKDCAPIHGNEYYASLMDFANKMDKLSKIKDDLKPYDRYNVKRLYEAKSSHRASRFVGQIVIDKDLVPKFMLSVPSSTPSQCDVELEAALTSDGVRKLAEECRRIKLETDIEKHRKDKVNEILK